jgi:peptide/nickel transport system permease protein
MTGRHAVRATAPAAAQAAGGPSAAPRSALPGRSWLLPARRGWRRAGLNPLTLGAAAVLVAAAAFCFAGPLLYHADITRVDLTHASLPPGAGHPLGTDADGVDVLGRLMAGGQNSLLVAFAAGLGAAVIGTVWGAVAGYLGGLADALLMRAVDAVIAVPTIVIMLALVSAYRPTAGFLVLIIAATSWLGTARLVRDETLTLRAREYVQAVRAMGGGRARAMLRHIAPNAGPTIVVAVSFQVADAVLLLATLSYLGLGIQPPASDWGTQIASGWRYVYDGYWWQIYPAAIAIIVVVVACHLLGDGLGDRMHPQLPGSGTS